MDIYLIRHTKVDVPEGLCYGDSDVMLDSNFQKDFEIINKRLPIKDHSQFYSSPISRCRLLAEYLSEKNVQFDERLKEMSFGNWTNQLWKEIPKKEINPWYQDYVNYKIPGGESFIELKQRVIPFIMEIINRDEDAMIVTHGGPFRVILAYCIGLDLEKSFNLEIGYGSIAHLNYKRGLWKLKMLSPLHVN